MRFQVEIDVNGLIMLGRDRSVRDVMDVHN